MGKQRTNMDIAYSAVQAIRDYWRKHPDANKFHAPKVSMDGSGAITSDMVNGYPLPVPRKVMSR
jgi:hypothetical protein